MRRGNGRATRGRGGNNNIRYSGSRPQVHYIPVTFTQSAVDPPSPLQDLSPLQEPQSQPHSQPQSQPPPQRTVPLVHRHRGVIDQISDDGSKGVVKRQPGNKLFRFDKNMFDVSLGQLVTFNLTDNPLMPDGKEAVNLEHVKKQKMGNKGQREVQQLTPPPSPLVAAKNFGITADDLRRDSITLRDTISGLEEKGKHVNKLILEHEEAITVLKSESNHIQEMLKKSREVLLATQQQINALEKQKTSEQSIFIPPSPEKTPASATLLSFPEQKKPNKQGQQGSIEIATNHPLPRINSNNTPVVKQPTPTIVPSDTIEASPTTAPPILQSIQKPVNSKKTKNSKSNARLLETVTENFNQKKMAAAIDSLPTKPSPQFYPIVRSLFELLPDYVVDITVQDTDTLLELVAEYMWDKNYLDELLEKQRSVAILLSRKIWVRNYTPITHALFSIVDFTRDILFRTVPRIENVQTYRQLLRLQTYLSGLLTSSSEDSYLLNKLYSPVLKQIIVYEARRTTQIQQVSTTLRGIQGNVVAIESSQVANTPTIELLSPEGVGPDSFEISPKSPAIQDEETKHVVDFVTLTGECTSIFEKFRQPIEEFEQKQALCYELKQTCDSLLGSDTKCTLHIYGSSSSNFGHRSSDLDICISLDNFKITDANKQVHLLQLIQKALESNDSLFKHIRPKQQYVIRSRVPVLKVVDSNRSIEADICVENFLGVINTRMLRVYSQVDPRVQPLVIAIKYWAKKRHINNPSGGSLSSYAFVLLAIQYLQTIGIVPSLQELVNHKDIDPIDIPEPHYVNAYECRYYGNLEKLRDYFDDKRAIDMTLGQLIFGFFKFYTKQFDFNTHTCSIKAGKPVAKKWTNAISIEDPFEIRDLGSVISSDMIPQISNEFHRAYSILSTGGSFLDCTRERLVEDENLYTRKVEYEQHIDKKSVDTMLKEEKLLKGILRVNKKTKFHDAYVTVDGFENDFYIQGLSARNRAMHGDLVAIRVVDEKPVAPAVDEKQQQTAADDEKRSDTILLTRRNRLAVVVSIIEAKAPRIFPCKLMDQDDNKGSRWLCPLDKAYPRIIVKFESFKTVFSSPPMNLDEVIFVVGLLPWKQTDRYPQGKLLGSLGFKKDLWTQKRATLFQYMPKLYDPIFVTKREEKVEATSVPEVIPVDPSVNVNDIIINVELETGQGYRDWRNRRVFTIDPITSKDLDDALSIDRISETQYLVTVYVADVTRFLRENDLMDLDARRRATSVYMVDTVEHMLNPKLSQNLCSLLPGVVRFAVAVQFKMNAQDATIDESSIEFARCIVSSCCQFDYDSVQQMIDGKDTTRSFNLKNGVTMDQLKNDCLALHHLAQIIRARRRSKGSLNLANQEIDFAVDQDGYPKSCSFAVHNESHELIEEFMLIANNMAGRTIFEHFAQDAVVRRHTAPDIASLREKIQFLAKGAVKMGITPTEFPIEQLLQRGESIQTVMNAFIDLFSGNPIIQRAVQQALLREMQLAKYVRVGDFEMEGAVEMSSHFALNMQLYTHFTSPIRRYADVLVHRQLIAVIESKWKKAPLEQFAPATRGTELSKLVSHLNDHNYAAKTVDECIKRQYLAHYIGRSLFYKIDRTEAVVVSIGRRSFTLFIPKYSIEVQCNVMQDIKPVPQSIKDIEEKQPKKKKNEGNEQQQNVKIESLLLTWQLDENGRRRMPTASSAILQQPQTESLEITLLKRVMVDLDVEHESFPYDIFVYNVTELSDSISDAQSYFAQPPTNELADFDRNRTTPKNYGRQQNKFNKSGAKQ